MKTATYDATKLLATVLNNAKSLSREDIAAAFMTIQNVEYITGTVRCRTEDLPDAYREKAVLIKLGENGRLNAWP